MSEMECCAGGHPATRIVYPFLNADPGTYGVCDNDEHLPVPNGDISEIERIQ